MKQHQKFVAALGMMLVLGGLSPVMAADATPPAGAEPERQWDGHSATPLKLSEEQLDNVHAGMDWASVGILVVRSAIPKSHDWMVDMGHVVICDEGGPCKVY